MSDTLTNLTRQVRCEDPLPHLVRRLQHRAPVVDSDSMDEDIQPPKAGAGPLYGTTAALRVSQVPLEGLQRRRTLGLRAQAIQGGTIAVHSNHPGAHAPQGQGIGPPDAPSTGDQTAPPLEPQPLACCHVHRGRVWSGYASTVLDAMGRANRRRPPGTSTTLPCLGVCLPSCPISSPPSSEPCTQPSPRALGRRVTSPSSSLAPTGRLWARSTRCCSPPPSARRSSRWVLPSALRVR